MTLSLVILTAALMIFTVIYMVNATADGGPFLPLPYQSPNSAVITAGFLFLFLACFLQLLKNAICNDLRWSRGRESDGIPVLDFVALDPSTPITGLIQLVAWDISKESLTDRFPVSGLKNIFERLSLTGQPTPKQSRRPILRRLRDAFGRCFNFRWLQDISSKVLQFPQFCETFCLRIRGPWMESHKKLALQRYVLQISRSLTFRSLFLFAFMWTQSIALLAGISITEGSDASSTQLLDLRGGVLPFSDSFLDGSRNFVRTYAGEMFGVLGNFTIWYRPTILDAYSSDCSPDWPDCLSQHVHYFLQRLQLDHQSLPWKPETPAFLELSHVPMCQMLLTLKSIFPNETCRLYGFRHARLRICAETISENGRDSIMLGSPPSFH